MANCYYIWPARVASSGDYCTNTGGVLSYWIGCHFPADVCSVGFLFGPVSLYQICSSVMVTLDGWSAMSHFFCPRQDDVRPTCCWGYVRVISFPQVKPAPPDMSSQGQWTLDRLWLIFVLKLSVSIAPRFLDTVLFQTRPAFQFWFFFFMSLCNMSHYSCYVLKGSRDHGKPGIRGFKWPCLMSRELEHLNGDISVYC